MSDPIDYEALARRALDVPPSADDHAALRVWADQLEAAGDPRGTLIALEHAAQAEPHRRRALRRAAYDHAVAHAGALLGPLADVARSPRALALDWRAGQLYGAAIDLQHIAEPDRAAALVHAALTAPVAAGLRRLELRLRPGHRDPMFRHGLKPEVRPPLEELIVFCGGAPSRALERRDHDQGLPLLHHYPQLRLFADDWFRAWPLDARFAPEPTAFIAAARDAAPESATGRAALGRALLHIHGAVRDPALERVVQLGPRASALAETLLVLLRADHVVPKYRVAGALGALARAARDAIPALAAITGRPAYDTQTRSAAGVALAALRQTS